MSTAQNQTKPETKPEAKAEAKPLLYVNYKLRDENRALPTDKVLAALQQLMPTQYALAEVVGQWVWIAFAEQPVAEIRAGLSHHRSPQSSSPADSATCHAAPPPLEHYRRDAWSSWARHVRRLTG